MSCIRALRNRLGVRSVVFLALIAVVVTMSAVASETYASSDQSDVVSDAPVAPPEEHEDGEGDSELPWLFAVFFITWAAFFGYVFVMSRRQREMQREIEALSLALQEREQREAEAESKASATDG
jgi:CcmD family protein